MRNNCPLKAYDRKKYEEYALLIQKSLPQIYNLFY